MSGELRVLIVDDEPLARRGLERLLAARDDCALAGTLANGVEALDWLERNRCDVVLLDVEMPELDGFDVVERIPSEDRPAIVFVTAFDRYAIRAFEEHALDYLLKPTSAERLAVALERVRAGLSSREAEARLAALMEGLDVTRPGPERIAIKSGGRTVLVPVAEILWMEAADNYVRLHTKEGAWLHREPLRELLERLNSAEVVRVHRSHAVRLGTVREIRPGKRGDATLVLISGSEVPISRTYRKQFETRLRDGG